MRDPRCSPPSSATTGPRRTRAMALYASVGGRAAVSARCSAARWCGQHRGPVLAADLPGERPGRAGGTGAGPAVRAGHPGRSGRRWTVTGTALLGVTLVALLVPLTEGRSLGWPAWISGLLASPRSPADAIGGRAAGRAPGPRPLVPPSLLATLDATRPPPGPPILRRVRRVHVLYALRCRTDCTTAR